MMDKNNQSHVVPPELLAKLQEYCLGGFVLFCFDKDKNPHIISLPESPIELLAFKDVIDMWLDTVRGAMGDGMNESLVDTIAREVIDELELDDDDDENDDADDWKKGDEE